MNKLNLNCKLINSVLEESIIPNFGFILLMSIQVQKITDMILIVGLAI